MKVLLLLAAVFLPAIAFAADGGSYFNPDGSIAANTSMTLERTGCYGTCPAYLVTVFADGSVAYEGRAYVQTKGQEQKKIGKEKVQELFAAFQRIDFLNLRNSYASKEDGCTEVWTDNPSSYITLSIRGENKKINHYYGCRGPAVLEDLKILENKIDEVSGSSEFVSGGAMVPLRR